MTLKIRDNTFFSAETVFKTILYNEKNRFTRGLFFFAPDPVFLPDPDLCEPKRPDPDPQH